MLHGRADDRQHGRHRPARTCGPGRRQQLAPAPVAGTASSPRFAPADVEAWLRRNGKQYRLSAADRAWQRLQSGGEDLLLPARLAAAAAHRAARPAGRDERKAAAISPC
jgi:hypothetical protein